jgi:hypothetical protein
MGNILIHHPWVQFYLLVVGGLLVAVLFDRLHHPQPPKRPSRPPEAGSPSPPGCEVLPPTDSHKKQFGRCQDRQADRIRE